MIQHDARPFLVSSRGSATGRGRRFQTMRQRTATEEDSDAGQLSELRAYRRIAASSPKLSSKLSAR